MSRLGGGTVITPAVAKQEELNERSRALRREQLQERTLQRSLMFYQDPENEHAKRLTRILERKNHRIFCLFNRAVGRYEVWSRTRNGAFSRLFRIQGPKGEWVSPDSFEKFVLQKLAEMDRPAEQIVEGVNEANRKRREREHRDHLNECAEIGKYFQRAISIEASGDTPRYSPADVALGAKQRWV